VSLLGCLGGLVKGTRSGSRETRGTGVRGSCTHFPGRGRGRMGEGQLHAFPRQG